MFTDRRLADRGIVAKRTRGIGIWKDQYEKEGFNPVTGNRETAVRNRLKAEYELPLGEAYAKMFSGFVE